MPDITIPELSFVVLIGASGSGKSTFARAHFKPTEVLSSDACRALVADDENDLSSTADAFEVLHYVAAKRLRKGRLTVVDATSVKPEDRKPLVALARQQYVLPVAIVLNPPESLCHERNRERSDRSVGGHVIHNHVQQLRRSLRGLKKEGFRYVYVLSTVEEITTTQVMRQRLWNDRRFDRGPFDIVGDVHGCAGELEELLARLGYEIADQVGRGTPWESSLYRHPEGRRAIFLGDLVDRGPQILDSVRLARAMVEAGSALCLPGNHDMKLVKKLRGHGVQIAHGLDRSLAELEALPEDVREPFSTELADFFDSLVSHYVLDDGKLVVAHAGMKEALQGRAASAVRAFALYGETTGETDEAGRPVRINWAAEYRGRAMVVYGHTAVREAEWLNNTINIDTSCVFGGSLTALRYPEKELVSVPAHQAYYRPAAPPGRSHEPGVDRAIRLSVQQQHDDLPDIADVLGKRSIATRLVPSVSIGADNAAAALEVMSRFTVNPKWLIYLPPTISPSETSHRIDLLEHPDEAFAYYRREGIARVICEEKHMGSRLVTVICRDEEVARRRFGVIGEGFGACYTRTGRPFFEKEIEAQLLTRLRVALDTSELWTALDTDWLCLDAELMPWSAKAQDLLRNQYAPVGAAGRASIAAARAALDTADDAGIDASALRAEYRERAKALDGYVQSYRRYCWPVESISDLKLAPFHILASEGAVYADRSHLWHMETAGRLCHADADLMQPTRHVVTDVTGSTDAAVAWWEQLTEGGGEGMVVKPVEFVRHGRRGLVQPALKCRGREYLRLIYGPEYTIGAHLERLRPRNVRSKRVLAEREFALGIEALERFVRGEPLRRVHECVFGVLALESEPIDPRL